MADRRVIAAAAAAVGLLVALAGLGGATAVDQGVIVLQDPPVAEFPIRGLDVSHHQGQVDWTRVAADPRRFRFVWIKATEGGDWTDTRILENWAGATAAGLDTGAYHYFTQCTPGARQAAHFLATLRTLPGPGALPPAVDLEHVGNCDHPPGPETVRAEIRTFLEAIFAALGQRPVIYTTRRFYRTVLGEAATDHPLWLRDVFRRPAGLGAWQWTVWQHLSRGRVDGFVGFVDLNVFRGGEAEYAAFLAGGPPP